MASPLLLFINPMSGGHLGDEVLRLAQNDPTVTIVKLPEEAISWTTTIDPQILNASNLRCIAAGGDGTVSWVASLLGKRYGYSTNSYQPPLGVIPLGSGNDMSRALGWGPSLTGKDIPNLWEVVNQIRSSSSIKDSDVWNILVSRIDTNEVSSRYMVSYFSVGCDAKIAKEFEDFRQNSINQCNSIAENQFHYFNIGLKNLTKTSSLSSYLKAFVYDGASISQLKFEKKQKTLVFQQIPSIYAGSDLWYSPQSRSMDDHKIEIVSEGGPLKLGLAHTGMHLAKQEGQGTGAFIETSQKVFYQIDGEGFESAGPTEFQLKLGGTYPLVFSA